MKAGGRSGPREIATFGSHDEAKEFRGALIANKRRDPRVNGKMTDALADVTPLERLTGAKTLAEAVRLYLARLVKLKRAQPRQIELYGRLFEQHVDRKPRQPCTGPAVLSEQQGRGRAFTPIPVCLAPTIPRCG